MEQQFQDYKKCISPSQESTTLRKRFTEEEDNILKHVIQTLGIRNWSEVAKYLPGRSGRQCRDRYNNYLFKDISFRPWTNEEDEIIMRKYLIFGNHWSKISTFLDGRSGNNVKNRWHKYLSKRYGDFLSKLKFISPVYQGPIATKPVIQIPPPPPIPIMNFFPQPKQYAIQVTYLFNEPFY
ncbi:hypothetical protein M9Y10_020583 [Tritrichomonas musculus]|uniref:Myb-like DNA-binding domain containing protein n=1 Tax=Tritrichomonas musculus TaxID=1915356 RepID=A0ABR2HE35_9EUKA